MSRSFIRSSDDCDLEELECDLRGRGSEVDPDEHRPVRTRVSGWALE